MLPFPFRDKVDKRINIQEVLDKAKSEEPLELEKRDMTAIILAALWTFLPGLLIIIAVVWGFTLLFTA